MRFIAKIIFKTAIMVIVLVTMVAVPAYFFPEDFLCVDTGSESADVLVVLGGGSHDRPARAAELFSLHAAPRIIVTGKGDDMIYWQILRGEGVPAKAIQLEGKSETTRENALFTIKLLRAEHVHSAILVTSWYHSRRALKTFEHYAPEIIFYSRPTYFALARADWKKASINRKMRLEFLKLPGYWIRYGINPF